jgi:signal peptidase
MPLLVTNQYPEEQAVVSPTIMPTQPRVGLRLSLNKILHVLLVLSTTFMGWKSLCVMTGSPMPIVCVTSESMAPAFHRGDVLILSNWQHQIRVGDIPVVWFSGYPLPMVHRAIKVWNTVDG